MVIAMDSHELCFLLRCCFTYVIQEQSYHQEQEGRILNSLYDLAIDVLGKEHTHLKSCIESRQMASCANPALAR